LCTSKDYQEVVDSVPGVDLTSQTPTSKRGRKTGYFASGTIFFLKGGDVVTLKKYWWDEIDHLDVAKSFVKNTPLYLLSISVLFLYPIAFNGRYAYFMIWFFYFATAITVFRPPYESTHVNLTITTVTLISMLAVISAMFGDVMANVAALWICLRFRKALVFLMDLGVMEINESESRFRD